ncbi:hypothetical protein FGD73_22425, partial [Escherichia coli]
QPPVVRNPLCSPRDPSCAFPLLSFLPPFPHPSSVFFLSFLFLCPPPLLFPLFLLYPPIFPLPSPLPLFSLFPLLFLSFFSPPSRLFPFSSFFPLLLPFLLPLFSLSSPSLSFSLPPLPFSLVRPPRQPSTRLRSSPQSLGSSSCLDS